MSETTVTELRRHLFDSLSRVAKGDSLKVRTREGNVVILSEQELLGLRGGRGQDPAAPKIPGQVVDLDDADKALRKHLRLPR